MQMMLETKRREERVCVAALQQSQSFFNSLSSFKEKNYSTVMVLLPCQPPPFVLKHTEQALNGSVHDSTFVLGAFSALRTAAQLRLCGLR